MNKIDINSTKFDRTSYYKQDQITGLDQWNKGSKDKTSNGKVYNVYKKTFHHQDLGWKVKTGFAPLLAMIFSFGLAYKCSKTIRKLWDQASSGNEVKKIKILKETLATPPNTSPPTAVKPLEPKPTPTVAKPTEPEPTPTAVKLVEPQPKPAVLPLEKTGGCENPGVTCYLASPFQLLKQIPLFRHHLEDSYSLKQKDGETEELFALRFGIKRHLYRMLSDSNEGKTISKERMTHLQRLMSRYRPDLSLDEGGTFLELLDILEIIHDGDIVKDLEDNAYHFENLKTPTDAPLFILRRFGTSENRKNTLLTNPLPTLQMPSSTSPSENYQLVGAIIGLPGHAIAAVKDIHNPQNEGWVIFNDQQVFKQNQLSEQYQEFVHILLYSRV